MVPRTYPESFRVIAQELYEKIDFPVRFSGQAIENCVAIQLLLHYSVDLLPAIFQARNNIFGKKFPISISYHSPLSETTNKSISRKS